MDYSYDIHHNLTLYFRGKLTSENASALGDEALKILSDNPCDHLIIDMEKLDHISSSGLRIIMKLAKAQPNIELIRVSRDVYDILDMTGFTKLFDVKRAMREFSVEGCDIIGQGAIGTIYRYDDETIIKVYRSQTPMETLIQERQRAQEAFLNGIPTAISYDIVKVGNQYGLIYELLDADTLAQSIAKNPEKIRDYAAEFARALRRIHSYHNEDLALPSALTLYRAAAKTMAKYMRPGEYELVSDWLSLMPEGNCFIHGDYTPSNIMNQDGELLLIDMGDISVGHPIWDLSVAYFVTRLLPPENSEKRTGIPGKYSEEFMQAFLSNYFGSEDPEVLARMEAVIRVGAYLRATVVYGFTDSFPREYVDSRLEKQRRDAFPHIEEFRTIMENYLPEMNRLLGLA